MKTEPIEFSPEYFLEHLGLVAEVVQNQHEQIQALQGQIHALNDMVTRLERELGFSRDREESRDRKIESLDRDIRYLPYTR